MSTRSLIARKTTEGFEAIYCHIDGYPDHHMPILRQNYTTDNAVEELLALGDQRSLGEAFEDGNAAVSIASEEDLLKHADDLWAEYVYVFAGGQWVYRNMREEEWRVASI